MLHLSRIEGMAIGVVLGGALQLVWQLPSLHRLGFHFHLALDWSDPGLQRILRLMVPAILGNAAVQINVMVNTNFASSISDPLRGLDGPVSWLSYAFRFMQLPLGLFGVAMASATLPSISRSAARGEHGRVSANAFELAGHGVSADDSVFGGTGRAGEIDYRRDLSGRHASSSTTRSRPQWRFPTMRSG